MTEYFELPPNKVASNESLIAATKTSQVIQSVEHQNTNLQCEGQNSPETKVEDIDGASDQTEFILTRVRNENRFLTEGWYYQEPLNDK
jgi:hypothetical protein